MTREARVLGTVSLVVGLAAVVCGAVAGDASGIIAGTAYLTFAVVGWVIARHAPGNAVATVFMSSTLLLGVELCGQQLATIGLREHWNPTVVHLAAWAQSWPWFPGLFLLITVGLLRFPDGALPGPGWRWVERASYTALAAWSVGIGTAAAMLPTRELVSSDTPHPHGLAWVAFFVVGEPMFGVVAACTFASLASLVARYRRSGHTAREQLKWVISAAVVAILIELGLDAYGTALGHTPDWLQSIGEGVGFGLIAVATGIAITRHKLYEIDRIVSRTVTYAVVVVVLAALYVAALLGLAAIVPHDLGQLGVAIATLVVSALAVPLTRRVRRSVDRRFNRSRFDAERVVTAFAADLRARPDRHDVTTGLVDVVVRTVQPSTVGVWIRRTPELSRRDARAALAPSGR